MIDPSMSRLETYRQVRIVLVRHMIDIGRLSVQISPHHLHLYGTLARLPGVTARLVPDMIMAIMGELGRIPGIRRVEGDFDNWKQDPSGAWVEVTRRSSGPGVDFGGSDSASRTFEVRDKPMPQPPMT